MTSSPSPLLLTLGHGTRSIDDVIGLLKEHDIGFLVDVRSAPYSRYQPNFSQGPLRAHLQAHDITYLYMGKELGGRPDDPDCYVDGKVIYDRLKARTEFQHGIGRLRTAWDQGRRVALLCSEIRPESCHRSKAIGPELRERGVDITHLDENDALLSQDEVDLRIDNGQMSLFDDVPSANASRSRKRYSQAAD